MPLLFPALQFLRRHWLAVVVAVLALVLLVATRRGSDVTLEQARRNEVAAIKRAEHADAMVGAVIEQNARALATAAALEARADSMMARVQHAKPVYAAAKAAAPDTCAALAAAADSVIAAQDSVIADEHARADLAEGQLAYTNELIGYARAGYESLMEASRTLVAASKPSLKSRLLPDEVGVFRVQGRNGVMVSWHF